MSTEPKENSLNSFIARNAWAIIIVSASVIGQWAVLGTKVTGVEERVGNLETADISFREELNANKSDVAALNAKVDAVSENVTYIRSRIDQVLRNQQ